MDGILIQREKIDFLTNDNKKDLFLLMEHKNLEIMLQSIQKDSLMWIAPTTDNTMAEFFYIVQGNLTLVSNDEETILNKGDCFYTKDLKGKVLLKSNTNLKLLYIATGHVFKYLDNFYGDLDYLLEKISEKDNYTKEHCKRVSDYCLLISQKFKCADSFRDNIVVASMFHDVGKCFIPDEILLKTGILTHEEFKDIYKHPTYSKKLLTGRFSKEIIDIVYTHHERLDGSGYPCGLKSDQISLETRIIAVADSFDAMTTKRPYNNAKTFTEAADELYSHSEKYDIAVTKTLKDLVDSGELVQTTREVTHDRI